MKAVLIDEIFRLGDEVRYVAVAAGQDVEMRARPDLESASSSESDRYEELLVNPALLTLTRQRGEIDCGGLDYLMVAYGRFFQLVVPRDRGHVSVAIERTADPVAIARSVLRLVR